MRLENAVNSIPLAVSMPPCLDIYVFSCHRNADTLNRFVARYADRVASEDRGDEELMMLKLDSGCDDRSADAYEWERAVSLTRILERALDTPCRAFMIYVKPRGKRVYLVTLAFTADDQVVLGLSLDDADGSEATLERAKGLLTQLAMEFDAHAGFIGAEESPPLLNGKIPPPVGGTILYSWRA